MIERRQAAALVLSVAVALTGCSAQRGPAAAPVGLPLRVGIMSDSPPYSLMQGGRPAGLEVDFARELGAALGRRLEFVPLDWEDQIPALLDRRTDIIMSGITITRARELTIAFSQPYLRSGLIALVRRADLGRYPTAAAVLGTRERVGVVAGTTGERFVREHCRAPLSTYPTASAAALELTQNRIDLFIHDAPVALWAVSRDEANLAPVLAPLDEESLGWAFRRDDDALRAAADAALARWRTDGTRARILTRWLPYWERLEKRVAEAR
jgi:ABC-type amino acid transport substrate-binding protein